MLSFYPENGYTLPSIKVNILLDQVVIGHFLLVPHSLEMYEIHTSPINKKHRGHTAEIGIEALKYGFKNMAKLQKLITFVPVHNRLASVLSRRAGMKLEGIVRKSFYFDGEMEDQELYGITREEVECL